MSTVWVVQEVPGRNLTDARRYGDLELLLPFRQIELDPERASRIIRDKLHQSLGYNDWLLLIGDPVAIGLAAAIFCKMNDGELRMLRWDRETRSYNPVVAQT